MEDAEDEGYAGTFSWLVVGFAATLAFLGRAFWWGGWGN